MLHGWMDVSASFQFVVDELRDRWRIIAPDWRGFGLSASAGGDCYWFPDYIADLERILDLLLHGEAAHLIGHSMGANVALLYAGVRPARVRTVVNLEGFGLRTTHPSQAPTRYAQWLDELTAGASLRDYATLGDVAARLRRTNPRLTADRAHFLAPHWAQRGDDGRWKVAEDPAHRLVNPSLYQRDEVLACWARIACPVLWAMGDATEALKYAAESREAAKLEIEHRRAALRDVEIVDIADAGHMLHHDQPAAVARVIEQFIDRRGSNASG